MDIFKRTNNLILNMVHPSKKKIQQSLVKLGYYDAIGKGSSETGESFRSAVHLLQEAYGLKRRDGELTPETRETVRRARCLAPEAGYRQGVWLANGRDPGGDADDKGLRVAFGTIVELSYTLSGEEAKEWKKPIRDAMDQWEKTEVVRFVENDTTPQIVIAWTPSQAADHDFGSNFIAHARFPSDPLPRVIHLNKKESWYYGPSTGCYNVFNLVMHELGHIMGLGHANEYDDDIMKNDFKTDDRNRNLSGHDIGRLVDLIWP